MLPDSDLAIIHNHFLHLSHIVIRCGCAGPLRVVIFNIFTAIYSYTTRKSLFCSEQICLKQNSTFTKHFTLFHYFIKIFQLTLDETFNLAISVPIQLKRIGAIKPNRKRISKSLSCYNILWKLFWNLFCYFPKL